MPCQIDTKSDCECQAYNNVGRYLMPVHRYSAKVINVPP